MKENDLLAFFAAHTPAHPRVAVHVGDDMAVVESGSPALLKIDQCLDRVHFDIREHSAAEVGRKAVNRCLSDCAAMACVPTAILISVALPRDLEESYAQSLFLACRDAAGAFDCPLVGGDTSIWDQRLAITVAALGALPSGQKPVLRSGAKAGDAIIVSGALGGSILGRHLRFEPRIKLARELASRVDIHAMMDLSDGLGQDLPRLCKASGGVGAVVAVGQLPVHEDAEALAGRDGLPAALHALADGEDYELLFTVGEEELPKLFPGPGVELFEAPLTRIGTVTAEAGLFLLDEQERLHPWPRVGWEHGGSPK